VTLKNPYNMEFSGIISKSIQETNTKKNHETKEEFQQRQFERWGDGFLKAMGSQLSIQELTDIIRNPAICPHCGAKKE